MIQRVFIWSITIIFALFSFSCAETVEGDWEGILEVQGSELDVNFHIIKSGNTYSSTMDVPSQGAEGIRATNTTFIDNELTIAIENMQMQYKGTLGGDVISGTYTQRGQSFPLTFTRMAQNTAGTTRSQDPKKPYPYTSEEIKFTNTKAQNIELAGTLTLPENVEKPPVVILISGDGGQDRDATMFGHRPFLVLSDFLTRNGIGVLRIDDRGVGDSKGTQRGITHQEIATDVEAAFSFLRSRTDINEAQIGLLGHSDGGYVAQIVASRMDHINFIILLGSPGMPFEGSKVHPKEYLSKVNCPVLALNGDKDIIRDAKTHLTAIKTVLNESGNKDVITMELENINHFFQTTTERGGIRAVSSIDETYAPKVLDIIKNWISLKTGLSSNARPQDPKKPYPYHSEEISFTNPKANNITLSGTLTWPKDVGNPPVAVLISGTGEQNRDGEIFNHRPFLVMSDYLTRNGIAVLRYDDRGVAESEGTLRGTTTNDLSTDVEAAVAYLKTRTDINPQKIGLIGHSEGGLIAPIVASRDKSIAFIVSLAGTAADGLTLLLTQERRQATLRGVSSEEINFNERILKRAFTIVTTEDDYSKIEELVQKDLTLFRKENTNSPYITSLTDHVISGHARAASNPKNIYFLKTSPKEFWTKVTCPILAMNGDKDSQVSSKIHLAAIKEAIEEGGNLETTIKELKGLNHLFQTAKTGSKDEYEQIEETFSPKALLMVKDWVIANTK